MVAPWPLYLVTLEERQVIIISFHLDLTTSLQGRYVIIILSNFNKMTTKYMDYVLITKIQTVQNKNDPHALSLSVPCSDR